MRRGSFGRERGRRELLTGQAKCKGIGPRNEVF
jgi:hypothetical protein